MLSAQLARTEHRHRSSPVRDHSHHYDEADPGVSTVEEVGDMVEASVTTADRIAMDVVLNGTMFKKTSL